MNGQSLLELKGYGHQLLKLLSEKRGETTEETYLTLSKAMGVKKAKGHFSTMNTAETWRAVNTLIRLLNKKPNRKKEERSAYFKELHKMSKMKLPQTELRAALAQLPKPKKLPFYKRIWNKI